MATATLGLARAKAMALVMLALPGAVFVYNGEELGLPNVESARRRAAGSRPGSVPDTRYAAATGAGCRCRGRATRPPFGFSDDADTWLPMPADWATLTVETQAGDPDSTLTFFQQAIELRHGRADFSDLSLEFLDLGSDVVAFRGGDGVVCVLNAGAEPPPCPKVRC